MNYWSGSAAAAASEENKTLQRGYCVNLQAVRRYQISPTLHNEVSNVGQLSKIISAGNIISLEFTSRRTSLRNPEKAVPGVFSPRFHTPLQFASEHVRL